MSYKNIFLAIIHRCNSEAGGEMVTTFLIDTNYGAHHVTVVIPQILCAAGFKMCERNSSFFAATLIVKAWLRF